MAMFKVGDRVRVIAVDSERNRHIVGATGTVIPMPAPCKYEYAVTLDGIPVSDWLALCWGFHPHQLAPLTDPKEDAFIAKVKSWGPLKEKPTYAELLDDVLAHIRGGSL